MQQGDSQYGYPQTPGGASSDSRTSRPAPSQGYTSGNVPTMNQMSPAQSLHPSSRPGTTSSHSYSRSSPSAKYVPFSPGNAPETPQYPAQRYYPESGAGYSQSPLALADIRGGMNLESEMLSPNPYRDAAGVVQSPSTYLAPWPIYAFDWCNWSLTPGTGAGKVAICSYLEDPHNFVSLRHYSWHGTITHHPYTDTNIRHCDRATRFGRTRLTTTRHQVQPDSRCNMLISHHTYTMGTAVSTEANDRPISYIW